MGNADSAGTLIIDPFLYLGPRSAASSTSFISSHGISHILSIGATPTTKLPDITYHRLSLNDSIESSISKCSEAANTIIHGVSKSKRGKILVHCSAGISRSPTIVVAYLMAHQNMSLKQALGTVIRARPIASPNQGFFLQLKKMEEELYGVVSLEEEWLPSKKEDRVAMFSVV